MQRISSGAVLGTPFSPICTTMHTKLMSAMEAVKYVGHVGNDSYSESRAESMVSSGSAAKVKWPDSAESELRWKLPMPLGIATRGVDVFTVRLDTSTLDLPFPRLASTPLDCPRNVLRRTNPATPSPVPAP